MLLFDSNEQLEILTCMITMYLYAYILWERVQILVINHKLFDNII